LALRGHVLAHGWSWIASGAPDGLLLRAGYGMSKTDARELLLMTAP